MERNKYEICIPMIFLDTSSAIEILNGNIKFAEVLTTFKKEPFAITSPSVFELYHGIYKLTFLKQKISKKEYTKLKTDLKDFISQLRVFSLDKKAANYAAKLHMQLKGKGHEIEVFDCLIASIILTNNFKKLLTENRKHFTHFIDLEIHSF
ncbi:MAG: type II toxin-antitoxin system VapC family toxin [Promethearchaeota archaeon]|nr:MAG: type II toxin-antitoxin system VapC family toxin [Candidatus Lokiarchaeota archaeon]